MNDNFFNDNDKTKDYKKNDAEEIEILDSEIVKKKKKKKISKFRKITKIFTIIATILSLLILCFSLYNIYLWYKDNQETEQQNEEIQNLAEVEEVEDSEKTETVNPPEDTFDPYWDYIKMPLINVDFNELLKTNDDTVGWLYVGGTNINYPVVQATDNSYYLNRSFDKNWNSAGWIFMDYRNNSTNFDKNTVIYGHSRIDRSMFGSLKWALKEDWFNNQSNRIIKLSTPTENTLWQVFSVYSVPNESYYISTAFNDEKEFQTWLDTMKSRSIFDFNTTVNTDDRILTLSSCWNSDGSIKTVIQAKLIKTEAR